MRAMRFGCRAAALGTVAGVLLWAANPVGATGQCTATEVEINTGHPDFLPTFAAGQLGILRPNFARSYLTVAYLYLTGGSLDAQAQSQVQALWLRRSLQGEEYDWPDTSKWLAVRKSVPGVPAPPKDSPSIMQPNCLKDAFVNATRTLEARRAELGADSAELKGWVAAQDMVFDNCGGVDAAQGQSARIPAALPQTAPARAQADRNYQIAAAHFYAGQLDDAAREFGQIAKDSASPWSSIGTYLQARAYLRQGIAGQSGKYDEARKLLERLASQPTSSEIGRKARGLLGFVLFRVDKQAYLGRLVSELRQSSDNYGNSLGDYVQGLDGLVNEEGQVDWATASYSEPLALRTQDEMTDWILSFQGFPPGSNSQVRDYHANTKDALAKLLSYALDRYHKTRSLPWLLAVLARLPAAHPEARDILKAAAQLPRTSPAFDTALYYSLALTRASLRDSDAAAAAVFRKQLDSELAARASQLPSSLRNQLLDWRMALASSLGDALDHSQRFVVGRENCQLLTQESLRPPPPLAKAELRTSDPLLKGLERYAPLSLQEALLKDPKLPRALRKPLLQLALSRALLIGETLPEAQALAERLAPQQLAEGNKKWSESLEAVRRAATPEERRFAVALLYLRMPELNPEHMSEWYNAAYMWCPAGLEGSGQPTEPPPFAGLFAAAQRASADKEYDTLMKTGGGIVATARAIIDYAKLHPEDPRAPQALYDLNRLSRRPCSSTEWSKRAFTFMHATYPNHPLTKKVKYWY